MGLAHSPRIVTDGLVLALDAGNTKSYPGSGTTWTDLSGNGNNGTINGATFNSNGYFDFDGSNDYVNNLSTALSDSFWQANWTASFWVRLDTISTTTTESNDKVILEHGTNTDRRGLKLFNRNSKVQLTITGPFNSQNLLSNSTISASTWYNLVWTLNNSTGGAEVYLNGSSDASNTLSTYIGTGSNTQIGFEDGSLPGLPFDGQMGKCDFYDRVLTSAEIKQNYNALRGRYGI